MKLTLALLFITGAASAAGVQILNDAVWKDDRGQEISRPGRDAKQCGAGHHRGPSGEDKYLTLARFNLEWLTDGKDSLK